MMIKAVIAAVVAIVAVASGVTRIVKKKRK